MLHFLLFFFAWPCAAIEVYNIFSSLVYMCCFLLTLFCGSFFFLLQFFTLVSFTLQFIILYFLYFVLLHFAFFAVLKSTFFTWLFFVLLSLLCSSLFFFLYFAVLYSTLFTWLFLFYFLYSAVLYSTLFTWLFFIHAAILPFSFFGVHCTIVCNYS